MRAKGWDGGSTVCMGQSGGDSSCVWSLVPKIRSERRSNLLLGQHGANVNEWVSRYLAPCSFKDIASATLELGEPSLRKVQVSRVK